MNINNLKVNRISQISKGENNMSRKNNGGKNKNKLNRNKVNEIDEEFDVFDEGFDEVYSRVKQHEIEKEKTRERRVARMSRGKS